MRRPVSRRRLLNTLAGTSVLAVGGSGQAAAATAPASTRGAREAIQVIRSAPGARTRALQGRRVLFGAWEPGPANAIDALEKSLGRPTDIVHWYVGWGAEDSGLDVARARKVAERGSIPMITWEPWDYRQGGPIQPRFRLSRIAAGDFDPYIRDWARAARDFGEPILLRFAHEMNAKAYPWSVGVNNNKPRHYVAAWRRVVKIFRDEGADNVDFVWCPNVPSPGAPTLASCFPGDAYVDVVGMDGYNAGTAADWGGWLTFSEVFGGLYAGVRKISKRPVIVAETGCAEQGGSKPDWLANAFLKHLPDDFPAVRAVVWYNESREANWRLDSSTATMRRARNVFTSGQFRA